MNDEDEVVTLTNFVPSQFVFVNFYQHEVCILWNSEIIVILDYPLPETLNSGIILKAPGKIKDIKSLKNKIYVLCSPSGIYKLSQNYTFARISTSGIGIGITFYQVFTPKGNILYCENKHLKNVQPICNIVGNIENIKFFHLYLDEIHSNLKKVLIDNKDYDSCLITNQKNLLLFYNNRAKIIYNCNTLIIDIIAFHKNCKIFGIILVTNESKIVLISPQNNELNCMHIGLNSQPKVLCAGILSFDVVKVWIIYCDGSHTYHLIQNLNNNDLATTLSITEKEFFCLTLYKSQKLSGLIKNQSDSIFFLDIPIEDLELIEEQVKESDTFQLKSYMIEGMDHIMDEISDKFAELGKINEDLEKERNLLRRINMYTIKRRVECVPKIKVYCLPDIKLIVANFQKNLPQGSQIIMSIHQNCGQMFVIKNVTDSETIVELSVPKERINCLATLHIHSIVVNVQSGPWCLIHDFIKDPVMRQDSKHPLDTEKLNFLNNKKMVLAKLISEKKIDMKTLSDIKRSIRRELPEV